MYYNVGSEKENWYPDIYELTYNSAKTYYSEYENYLKGTTMVRFYR